MWRLRKSTNPKPTWNFETTTDFRHQNSVPKLSFSSLQHISFVCKSQIFKSIFGIVNDKKSLLSNFHCFFTKCGARIRLLVQ